MRSGIQWTLIISILVAGFLSTASAAPDADGAAVYSKFGCQTCHGGHRGGTSRGPSLRSVATVWDEKTLPVYLQNPAAAREKNERLQKLSNRYAPTRMLQFEFKDEELKVLVKFLLQNSKSSSTQTKPAAN